MYKMSQFILTAYNRTRTRILQQMLAQLWNNYKIVVGDGKQDGTTLS